MPARIETNDEDVCPRSATRDSAALSTEVFWQEVERFRVVCEALPLASSVLGGDDKPGTFPQKPAWSQVAVIASTRSFAVATSAFVKFPKLAAESMALWTAVLAFEMSGGTDETFAQERYQRITPISQNLPFPEIKGAHAYETHVTQHNSKTCQATR